MLKTRVITALWLAPLAFLLIFALPTRWFAAVLALLLLVGAWEYQRLAALEGSAGGWALITAQAIIFLGIGWYWDLLLQQAQVVVLMLDASNAVEKVSLLAAARALDQMHMCPTIRRVHNSLGAPLH